MANWESFGRRALAVLSMGAAFACRAQVSLVDASPFQPPGGAAGSSASGTGEAYELAGACVTNKGSQVCVFDTQAKRSHWIAVGSTEDGIKVISYDSVNDRALISVNGSQKSLTLRKSAVVSLGMPATPAPAPSYFNPGGPMQTASVPQPQPALANLDANKPPEVLKQEREARMLVSDLLDISIQQRKAYEEAQQKAAQAKAAGQPQP